MIISAREANQQFSKLLEAAGGEVVTITRRGVPVARLVPAVDLPAATARSRERARRREELLAQSRSLRRQGSGIWTP